MSINDIKQKRPTSLMHLEDSVLMDNDFGDLRIPAKNEFYPTDASYEFEDGTIIGKCARAVYFSRVGVEKKPFSIRTLHTFALGHNIEDHTIESHKAAGIFVAREVSFTFPLHKIVINGRMDEIVILDGEYVGVEIKSGHGHNFLRQHVMGYKRKPTKNSQPHLLNQLQSAPKPEHLLQAGIYLYYTQNVLPLIKGFAINSWRLYYRAVDHKVGAEYLLLLEPNGGMHKLKVYKLYISSNESDKIDDFEEIMVKDIYVEKIFERFQKIYDYIEQGIVPPADYDITPKEDGSDSATDWQCNYCPYAHICKELPREAVDDSVIEIIKSPISSIALKY